MVNICSHIVIWNILVYNYPYNMKGENTMNTKEIKLADGKILTPVEYPGEQMKKFSEMMDSPQYQNYAANQMKEQLYKNLSFNEKPEQPKNIMVEKQSETNELIEFTNEQILELQNQLKDSKVQLKQANDKLASQTLVIKQLKADLKEESEKADKISSKDIMLAIITGFIGLLAGLICAYFAFSLNG